MKTCYFCSRTVKGKPEHHHLIPKRYFKPGQNHRQGNLVPVCPGCHRRFHRRLDDPSLSQDEYLDRFGPSLGEGVFAR